MEAREDEKPISVSYLLSSYSTLGIIPLAGESWDVNISDLSGDINEKSRVDELIDIRRQNGETVPTVADSVFYSEAPPVPIDKNALYPRIWNIVWTLCQTQEGWVYEKCFDVGADTYQQPTVMEAYRTKVYQSNNAS